MIDKNVAKTAGATSSEGFLVTMLTVVEFQSRTQQTYCPCSGCLVAFVYSICSRSCSYWKFSHALYRTGLV